MSEPNLIDSNATFTSFAHILDTRILRALADMGFARPTLVQAKAIPLALDGKDILARARTGSGKTAAYCVPIVQKILNTKATIGPDDPSMQAVRALILVPTRELSEQVAKHLRGLLKYCEKEVTLANLASGTSAHLEKTFAADSPDIIIATPSRVLSFVQAKMLSIASLESLVIDEADLVLSYGHDEDIQQLFNGGHLPKVFQSFLMSATMTEDVEKLKGLALRNPVILKLEEDQDDAARLSQYSVRCSEVDKFLLTYVILKLKLIKGKCILFVNDVERCYRLKLFLEQFSIKSCVLNSELPLNSRMHIVQEFNKGIYDYIIATDESNEAMGTDSDDEPEEEEEAKEDGGAIDELISTQRVSEETQSVAESSNRKQKQKQKSPAPTSRKRRRDDDGGDPETSSSQQRKSRKSRKRGRPDKEYGVVRGVDFIDVACVLNFDIPSTSRAYTHRVGRTARAGRTGMALSFIVPAEVPSTNNPQAVAVAREGSDKDEAIFSKIEKDQGARGSKIKEYKFDMRQVEAFRYRMQDALRAVTRHAIKEARLKELKTEILNSDKLKAHFEDNPNDLEFLRHDKTLHPTRVQSHMKHVPKYLLPRSAAPNPELSGGDDPSKEAGFVPFRKGNSRGRGRGRGGRGGRGSNGRGGKRKADPLKKFGR